MRGRCIVALCAVLGGALSGALGGCSVLGTTDLPERIVSQPPAGLALAIGVFQLAKKVNWTRPEASPVRRAHLLSPGDWVVCAQSSARDLSPVYALFFDGDKMVDYRIAVEVDECGRAPFALVAEPPPPEEKKTTGILGR